MKPNLMKVDEPDRLTDNDVLEMNWLTDEPVGRTTSVGEGRVTLAWKHLAPDGPQLPWRLRQLEKLARDLIRRRGADFATTVYYTIRSSHCKGMIDDLELGSRRDRADLIAEISQLENLLNRAIDRARRLKYRAAFAIRPEGAWIDDKLSSVLHDPLFQIQPLPSAGPGNPKKKRNMRLRRALRTHGLTHQQITTVMSAIQYRGEGS